MRITPGLLRHRRVASSPSLTAIALCAALFTSSGKALAIDAYPGEGHPVIGATVVATGGDVTATFVSGSGCYYDYLYLDTVAPGDPDYRNAGGGSGETQNYIFVNHGSAAGTHVDLGSFPAGTELVFHVVADTSCSAFGPGPYLDWYTGPATRNADGFAHAWVDSSYTGPYGGTAVGFEDLSGLGDAGYEDLVYTFSNVTGGEARPCDPQTTERAQIEAQCNCGTAANHGKYLKCVAGAAKSAGLSKTDTHALKKCEAKSTCGKPGFVTCCRTNAKGKTRCSIKHGAAKCKAPKHGTAAVGTHASCCDACTATTCVPTGSMLLDH